MLTLIVKDEPSNIIFRFDVENGITAIVPMDVIKSARASIVCDQTTVISTHEGRIFKLPVYLPTFVAMLYYAREQALLNVDPINYHVVDIKECGCIDHVMKPVKFDKEFVMELADGNDKDEKYTFLASSTKPASVIRQQFIEWLMKVDEECIDKARNQEIH